MAYSPDGAFLASGSLDKTIRIWNITEGKEIKKLEGHLDKVYSVTYSPDGAFLASGSGDGTIRIWNVAEGKEI